jgi:hypothetical protein
VSTVADIHIDWRKVAVNLGRPDGGYHLLSTAERDALEAAMDDAAEIARDARFERTQDAGDR